MTTENAVAAEQNTVRSAESVEPITGFPAEAGQCLESAGQEVLRSADQVRTNAKHAVQQVRHELQSHPLVVLAATAVGCLAVGLTAGWVIGLRRSR
jgi:ElaB/YqjD/DUF883 family membrane-anchored ribosome-binding protein